MTITTTAVIKPRLKCSPMSEGMAGIPVQVIPV